MAEVDYLGLLGQGVDYYQMGETYDQARDDMQGGLEQARTDLTTTQQPYVDFGLESMQNYQDMGDFSFSNEDFYRDPSYQFRLDESMRETQRSAAGRGMLNSTNTLNSLTERAGDLASQEYQAAFDRAKGTYEVNLGRNEFGVQVGGDVAMNLGNNLADLGIAEGAFLSSLTISEGEALSKMISSTLASLGQASDPNTVSGMVNDAIQSGVDSVGEFVGSLFGGEDGVTGAIGGAVDAGLGLLGMGGAAVGDTMLGTGAANTALTWGTGGLDAALAASPELGVVLSEAGITSAAEGAAATGLTEGAFSTFMAGIGGTALTLFGPIALGLATIWAKDKRSYTDRTEDELAKAGDPVLSATGTYLQAMESGDREAIKLAGGVMMDTINNPENTTSVQNGFYADFINTSVMDALTPLAVGGYTGSTKTQNYVNDTGKALVNIFDGDPKAEEVKKMMELLQDMEYTTGDKYNDYDRSTIQTNIKILMNQLLASKPEWGVEYDQRFVDAQTSNYYQQQYTGMDYGDIMMDNWGYGL